MQNLNENASTENSDSPKINEISDNNLINEPEHNNEIVQQNKETENIPEINDKSNYSVYENSKFDTTMWDRKFHDVDELPITIISDKEFPFTDKYKKFKKNNYALLWHVRMGHASIAYLRALQKRFPLNKELTQAIFDDSILDCEVCKIAKFRKLPFNST